MNTKLLTFVLAALYSLTGCSTSQGQLNVKVDNKLRYTMKECKTNAFSSCRVDRVQKIDKIVIKKSKKTLYTYSNGKIVDSYKISMGKNWNKGHKLRQGDNKTPEGTYKISYKQYSKNFYKSLKISYPNKKDINQARNKGYSPGGYIMIHGQPRWNAKGLADNYMLNNDWTAGCVALRNTDIDKLFYAVENGVSIEIKS